MSPQKRSRKRDMIVNVCLGICICFFAWRLYHREQLPSLLLQAVDAQDVSAVKQLLAEGANPSTRDSYHYSVLDRAMYPFHSSSHRDSRRMEQIMRLLLEAGAKPDCLSGALNLDSEEPALCMIAKGASVTPDMLGRSVHLCSARLLQQIWEKSHADVNVRFGSMTPLGWLANARPSGDEEKQLETANWLLAHGADPNIGKWNKPERNRPEISADNGRTPLMDAIFLNRPALARLLLKNGARMEAHDAWGNTVLMQAVGGNAVAGVRELIAGGANVRARNEKGFTVLHVAQICARQTHNTEIVNMLRQAGATE